MNIQYETRAFRSALTEWHLLSVTRARWAARTKPEAIRLRVEALISKIRDRHGIENLHAEIELCARYGKVSRPVISLKGYGS